MPWGRSLNVDSHSIGHFELHIANYIIELSRNSWLQAIEYYNAFPATLPMNKYVRGTQMFFRLLEFLMTHLYRVTYGWVWISERTSWDTCQKRLSTTYVSHSINCSPLNNQKNWTTEIFQSKNQQTTHFSCVGSDDFSIQSLLIFQHEFANATQISTLRFVH